MVRPTEINIIMAMPIINLHEAEMRLECLGGGEEGVLSVGFY